MICPKCGKEMTLGKISMMAYYGYGSSPFWAEKSYFTKETFPNAKDAEQKGVGIPLIAKPAMIDVAFSNLPDGYACKDCKIVLIDCNE